MDLRALLLGTKLKAAGTAVLVLTATVSGAWAVGLVGTPSVATVENRFGPVDQLETTIETDLVVHNPNPIGVQLGDTTINYTVAMNNVSIARGTKRGLSIGSGNTTLNFSTRMRNEKIPEWWVTHVRNGEQTTVAIDAKARTGLLGGRVFPFSDTKDVQTDIIGQFNSDETRPVNAEQTPPTVDNPVLYVNATRASWGQVTAAETPIAMQFDMYNPNLAPYTVSEVGYEITMNGIRVGGGETREQPAIVIPSQTRETLDTRTVIDNPALDDWWVSHLQNDQVTNLRIDFYAIIKLPAGQTVRAPLDRVTYEKRIETDIFGTKNQSTSHSKTGTPSPDGGDGTDDSTDGSGTGPDTPTPTPTDGILGLKLRPVA